MTRKWNLIVDLDLCVNCHNCSLATKDEHVGNAFPGYSAAQTSPGADIITIGSHTRGSGTHVERTYVPRMCMHCDDAPCINKDTTGAITKRKDGIVFIDPDRGERTDALPALCPYGMIRWDDEAQAAHIWNFDVHLLDAGWTAPRCVTACPTRAMEAISLDDGAMAAKVKAEMLEVFPGTAETRPRVYYRNAHRLKDHLIAGTVLHEVNGITECASGMKVELYGDGQICAETTTDPFGEFNFRQVSSHVLKIELLILHEGDVLRTVSLQGGTSSVLDILLET